MISPKLAGAAILAIPLIIVAWTLLWRRQRPVLWLALALIAVGTGYLAATGATDDIALRLVPGLVQPDIIRTSR